MEREKERTDGRITNMIEGCLGTSAGFFLSAEQKGSITLYLKRRQKS